MEFIGPCIGCAFRRVDSEGDYCEALELPVDDFTLQECAKNELHEIYRPEEDNE